MYVVDFPIDGLDVLLQDLCVVFVFGFGPFDFLVHGMGLLVVLLFEGSEFFEVVFIADEFFIGLFEDGLDEFLPMIHFLSFYFAVGVLRFAEEELPESIFHLELRLLRDEVGHFIIVLEYVLLL